MVKEEQNCGINWKRAVEKLLLHKLIADYNKGLQSSQGRLTFSLGKEIFAQIWAKENNISQELSGNLINAFTYS